MAKRLLILEDGTIFEGQAGADVDVTVKSSLILV